MSLPLVVNGVTYNYPEVDDTDWGPDATDWASAVTTGMLQKAGGLFQLLAEVDFGTSFGVKSLYLKSRTSNPADAGFLRLAHADVINWRNNANSANLSLSVDASDVLNFNGSPLQGELSVLDTSTIDLDLSADVLSADIVAGSIDNSLISASAAIAFSKLASLTSGNILVGSAGNVATSVAMTGDISITNAGVTAIGANKVLNSMLAQMAQATIKGRAAGAGSGDPVDLTATQATAILDNFVGDSGSGGTKGLVPAPAPGDAAAQKFLFADGTWTTPPGSGDVVGPGSSTDNGFVRFDGTTGKLIKDSPPTISNADVAANAAIAFSKLAALSSANIIVGNGSSVPTAVAVTGDISLSNAGVTAYAGTVPLNKGGTGQTTKAAAFDALSPMTTGGDLIYGGASGTGTRLANGSAGQVLTSAGGTSAPIWGFPGFNYTAQTTTYSAAINDYILASGSSFTTTFPTAVGNAGKMIGIQHNGTSLTQVYTLNTTSGQTIGGVASGSYALYTNGEVLTVISDGANWQIVNHKTNNGPVSAGPIPISATSAYVFTVTAANATVGTKYTNNGFTYTVTTTITGTTTLTCSGTGTPATSGTLTKSGSGAGDATITFSSRTITGAPVFGTTTKNACTWWRNGNLATIEYRFRQTVAGTTGSGDYTLYLPTGMSADTSIVSLFTTIGTGIGSAADGPPATLMAVGNLQDGGSTTYNSPLAALYSSTQFRIGGIYYGGPTGFTWGSGIFGLSLTNLGFGFTIQIPISGWQP